MWGTEKVGPAYLLPEGINQGNDGRILVDQIHVQVHHLSRVFVCAHHHFVLALALMRVRKAVKDKCWALQTAAMSSKPYRTDDCTLVGTFHCALYFLLFNSLIYYTLTAVSPPLYFKFHLSF